MKYFRTGVAAAFGSAALAVGFVYSGLFNVSAMEPHNALTNWLLSTTMHVSVARRAGTVQPPDLGNDTLQLAGAADFEAMCVTCHGAPEIDAGPIGQGLTPRPPSLAEAARHLSDGELFWITKHGIKMTGMPAWGRTHSDEALWPVVAFMRLLPSLDGPTYRQMLARAEGSGHHAQDAGTAHVHDAGDAGAGRGGKQHDHGSAKADGAQDEAAPGPARRPAAGHSPDGHAH